jgi:hypothetical protein
MKRAWEGNSGAAYGAGSGSSQDESPWAHMSSHPYASAYSSLPNPFQPSPLHNEQHFDQDSSREYGSKRPRASDAASLHHNGSEAASEGGDDDEDDDDDDDGDDSLAGASGRKGKKGGKDSKAKVKLTRGSR